MGTIYFVGCFDCKKFRDLDKFYAAYPAKNRKEALELATKIEKSHSFRAALLASFMAEHRTHSCTMFTEHDDWLDEFFSDNAEEESELCWKVDAVEVQRGEEK